MVVVSCQWSVVSCQWSFVSRLLFVVCGMLYIVFCWVSCLNPTYESQPDF